MPKPVDNKNRMPLEHYQAEFAEQDPEAMSARTGMRYDSGTQDFTVEVLGRAVLVHWPDMRAEYLASGMETRPNLRILLGCFLTHGRSVPGTGKFISYEEVPWGAHYFDAFRRRCLVRLSQMFETASAFSAACERAGGQEVAGGDAAYEFEFIKDVFVRLTFWEGDEEFPAKGQITFSDNISLAFTAEEIAHVGDVLLGSVQRAADEESYGL